MAYQLDSVVIGGLQLAPFVDARLMLERGPDSVQKRWSVTVRGSRVDPAALSALLATVQGVTIALRQTGAIGWGDVTIHIYDVIAGDVEPRGCRRPARLARCILDVGSRRLALRDGEHSLAVSSVPRSGWMWRNLRHHARMVDVGEEYSDRRSGQQEWHKGGRVPLTGLQALRDGDRIHVGPILIVPSASGMSTETVDPRSSRSRSSIKSVR